MRFGYCLLRAQLGPSSDGRFTLLGNGPLKTRRRVIDSQFLVSKAWKLPGFLDKKQGKTSASCRWLVAPRTRVKTWVCFPLKPEAQGSGHCHPAMAGSRRGWRIRPDR